MSRLGHIHGNKHTNLRVLEKLQMKRADGKSDKSTKVPITKCVATVKLITVIRNLYQTEKLKKN